LRIIFGSAVHRQDHRDLVVPILFYSYLHREVKIALAVNVEASLCNSPRSSATTPLATTIPSEVITVPEMNVWARAGDSAGRIRTEHTKIKQKEKNNLFMGISNHKLHQIPQP
jgi:hypothetical protein